MPQASACCGKAVLWGIPRGYSPNQDVRLGCTGCLHPQSGLLQTLRPRAGTFWGFALAGLSVVWCGAGAHPCLSPSGSAVAWGRGIFHIPRQPDASLEQQRKLFLCSHFFLKLQQYHGFTPQPLPVCMSLFSSEIPQKIPQFLLPDSLQSFVSSQSSILLRNVCGDGRKMTLLIHLGKSSLLLAILVCVRLSGRQSPSA